MKNRFGNKCSDLKSYVCQMKTLCEVVLTRLRVVDFDLLCCSLKFIHSRDLSSGEKEYRENDNLLSTVKVFFSHKTFGIKFKSPASCCLPCYN